ncbi:GTPase-associated system all-helical protein GASH [Devosia sp. Leaf420]|uniref:GTPase-associated system all-helical protein GASH n=1 Tax=Devosia sp. Leaf420 TaxID=1736374 RepID=UPI000AE224B5|nr:GTPase-associated system all-helical protein GASH [Devosia sp. Leaf420]
MTQDILQRFLSARHFDVGGDDDRLARLREAAGDLALEIKSSPQRVASLTMVAIDAKTPAGDPVLVEVGKILEKRWHSYAGAFSDATLPVVMRAIALDALDRSSGSDAVAMAISATARNMLPYLGSLADRELWNELVENADRRLEGRARREWAQPSAASAGDTAFVLPKPPEIAKAGIKPEWAVERMAAAAGPMDAKNATLTDANPHWPNQGQPWSLEFAPKAGKALAMAGDSIGKQIADSVNSALADQSVASALVEHVTAVVGSLAQTAGGLERRTSMLWWKEALYSPAADIGYRDMEVGEAACWAAVDAVDITGPYAPRMAEAFVMETVRSFASDAASRPLPLLALAGALCEDQSPRAQALRSRLSEVQGSGGRTPLASLVAAGQTLDDQTIEVRLGLPPDMEIAPTRFSLWIFRDMQAARATASRTRKKGGK